MKKNKNIIFVLIILTAFISCKKNTKQTSIHKPTITYQCPMKCEGEKTFTFNGSCAICKMDLRPITSNSKKMNFDMISDESIFNLTSKWKTEEGNTIELKDLRGKTLVMVMIYTTCKAACPRLVADMRNIEKHIQEEEYKKDIHYVLVSIDPENDTPEHLKSFAKENLMDGAQWTFLQGTKSSIREFANVLAVKYKEISPLDFSHSNIISVFNPKGELVHQQEGLGVDNKETILKIKETLQPTSSI